MSMMVLASAVLLLSLFIAVTIFAAVITNDDTGRIAVALVLFLFFAACLWAAVPSSNG
jgi:uncharacterized protein with PQ loop repeat